MIRNRLPGRSPVAYRRDSVGVGEMWSVYTPPDEHWSRRVTEEGGLIGREREGRII